MTYHCPIDDQIELKGAEIIPQPVWGEHDVRVAAKKPIHIGFAEVESVDDK